MPSLLPSACMWGLNNETRFSADRAWVRDVDGDHLWLVAVKATYTLDDAGQLELATEQLPVLHEPEYFGPPGASSIRFESDLGAAKPTTDVLVNGSAHAPQGEPARSVTVGLAVGAQSKSLVVHGTRTYFASPLGLSMSRPEPFVSKAIRYEAAFGGGDASKLDMRNPVGLGFATAGRSLDGTLAPSIEYPGRDLARSGPAGFGALASYWEPRLSMAGTYDARWVQSRMPLLPKDVDERYAQCAPADQRPPTHLRGGEVIGIVGMSPRGTLRFRVPTIALAMETRFGRHRRAHEATLSSLIVEPDERRVVLCWQSSLKVGPREVERLDHTHISKLRGAAP